MNRSNKEQPQSHWITLQPSGKRFIVEPNESILAAALRSGIDLPYHCANGKCGGCKAQLLAGKVRRCEHSDYPMTDLEKQQQFHLLCSTTPTSDIELAARESTDAGGIAEQMVRARIIKQQQIGAQNMVLRVRTPRSQTLRFLSGQHIELTMEGIAPIDLFIASCPCNGLELEFHLQLHKLSPPLIVQLFSHDLRGETIQLRGPFGSFTLQPEFARPLVLFAENSGFAPIKSLMEHSLNLEISQPILLIWFTHSKGVHYQENHCLAWADAFEHIRYLPLQASSHRQLKEFKQPIIDAIALLDDPIAYVSGCRPLLVELLPLLEEAGIPMQQIYTALCRGVNRQERA